MVGKYLPIRRAGLLHTSPLPAIYLALNTLILALGNLLFCRKMESLPAQGVLIMPIELPEPIKQFLTLRAYGHVVTRNPDGSPQMSMVWMDVEGNKVLFNTAEGRIKPRNLRSDPRILISVQNPLNPQAHAIFHRTETVTAEGADQHIDMPAKRFLGMDKYPRRRPGEKRLIVRTRVDRIAGFGF